MMYLQILTRPFSVLLFVAILIHVQSYKYEYGHDEECSCGQGLQTDEGKGIRGTRIMAGYSVEPENKYPFVVTIRHKTNGQLICGGAIISSRFILTAAHCIEQEADEFKVITSNNSKNQGQSFDVSRVIRHESYNDDTNANDVALFELKEALPCNEYSKPICLATPGMEKPGMEVTVAGYGLYEMNNLNEKESKILREGTMKILHPAECQKRSKGGITTKILCTIGTSQGSCKGDSGTSVFAKIKGRYYSLGITSTHTVENCDPRYPVKFAKTSAYTEWIKKNAFASKRI